MGTRVIGGLPQLVQGQTSGDNETALRVDAGAALETTERPFHLHPTDDITEARWTVNFSQDAISTNTWIAGSDQRPISTYPRPPQVGSDYTTPTRVRLRLTTPQANAWGYIIGRSADAGSNGEQITVGGPFDPVSGNAQDSTFVMSSGINFAILSSASPNSGLAPMSVIDQVVLHGNITGNVMVQIGTAWDSGTGTLTYTTAWTIDPLKDGRAAIAYAIPGAGFSPNQRLVVERVTFRTDQICWLRLMQCPEWLYAAGPTFFTRQLMSTLVSSNERVEFNNLWISCGGSSQNSLPSPNTSSPWSIGWGAVYLEIQRGTSNPTSVSGSITFRLVRSPTDVPA